MQPPPADPATALAAKLTDYPTAWIDVRCRCGRVVLLPVKMLLRTTGGATVGAVVERLKCQQCRKPPTTVHLCETPHREATLGPGPPGWSVVLRDGDQVGEVLATATTPPATITGSPEAPDGQFISPWLRPPPGFPD